MNHWYERVQSDLKLPMRVHPVTVVPPRCGQDVVSLEAKRFGVSMKVVARVQ